MNEDAIKFKIDKMLEIAKPLIDAKRKYEMSRRQGKFVSKNEALCVELLSKLIENEFEGLELIANNIDVLPGWEVDMLIKSPYGWDMVIEWDGAYHRKPIYGETKLRERQGQDRFKNKRLFEEKYILIRVKDDGSYNPAFVQDRVNKIGNILRDMIQVTGRAYGKIEI